MITHYVDAWRHWNQFKGRTQRPAFWSFVLIHLLVVFMLTWGDLLSPVVISLPKIFVHEIGLFSGLYGFVSFIPFVAICVRRLRDAGFSGCWVLINLVPIIGFMVLAILFLQKTAGTQHVLRRAAVQPVANSGIDSPTPY